MMKKNNHIQDTNGMIIGRWCIRIFFFLWAVLVVFPVIWTLYTSLKTDEEFFKEPFALPKVPQWDNFVDAWNEGNFGAYFFNSIVTVLVTLAVTLVVSAPLPMLWQNSRAGESGRWKDSIWLP